MYSDSSMNNSNISFNEVEEIDKEYIQSLFSSIELGIIKFNEKYKIKN